MADLVALLVPGLLEVDARKTTMAEAVVAMVRDQTSMVAAVALVELRLGSKTASRTRVVMVEVMEDMAEDKAAATVEAMAAATVTADMPRQDTISKVDLRHHGKLLLQAMAMLAVHHHPHQEGMRHHPL